MGRGEANTIESNDSPFAKFKVKYVMGEDCDGMVTELVEGLNVNAMKLGAPPGPVGPVGPSYPPAAPVGPVGPRFGFPVAPG